MTKHAYSVLSKYLNQLSIDFDIHICINDFSGFLFLDPELAELLQPFMIHGNPYCMMIKSDKALWHKCQKMKKPIAEKCRAQHEIFYGMCHAGVEEFIVPILSNNQLIGTINVGIFRSHGKAGGRIIKKIAQNTALNESTLLDLYDTALKADTPEIEKLNNLLSIAAEYISIIYSDFSLSYPELINHIRYNPSEDNILGHTLEYIKKNYKNQISVPDIARFCHCSVSCINHIFKKKMKVNVKLYINQHRVRDAKIYLAETDLPIKTISSCVGFNDSNYFCKVFSEICGMSPTQFRSKT